MTWWPKHSRVREGSCGPVRTMTEMCSPTALLKVCVCVWGGDVKKRVNKEMILSSLCIYGLSGMGVFKSDTFFTVLGYLLQVMVVWA